MAMAQAMSDRVRDVGDGLILGFPISTTEVAQQDLETVRLYFFRVSSQTRYFQKHTSLSSINSGNTSPSNGFDYLGDGGVGSGSDIFRMETDDWHVMHFGFATNHPDLEVFTAVSPSANGNPAQDRSGQSEDISPGTDDRGWVAQAQIDERYDPPDFTERVSFRNDNAGEFLEWAFYADGTNLSGNELDLLFTGRAYKLQPVTDVKVRKLMLQTALASVEEPALDTIYTQIGGVNNYTLGSEEPDSWETVRQREQAFTAEFNVEEIGPPWLMGGGGRGGGGRGGGGGQPPGRQQRTMQQ